MTGIISAYSFLFGFPVLFDVEGQLSRGYRFLLTIIFIKPFTIFFGDFLCVQVRHIRIARGVHPAAMRVKSLVHKKLPPGNRAINIKTLIAYYLHLITKVK